MTVVGRRKIYVNFFLLPSSHLLPMLPSGQTQAEASGKQLGEQGFKEVMWTSYGECNRFPYGGWLAMTGTYSLMVLKARSLKSRCLPDHLPSQVSRGDFLCLVQLHVAPALLGLWLPQYTLCLCLHVASPSPLIFSSSVPHKDT